MNAIRISIFFGSARQLPVESFRIDARQSDAFRLLDEVNEMTRKYIDCREYPSEMNCTVALSADSEAELLNAAVQHAVAVHQHQDTPELRTQLQKLFKDGTPPIEAVHS
jgi:predicted small metal-binding protein